MELPATMASLPWWTVYPQTMRQNTFVPLYLLAGVYLVTAMPKVNNIAGLGHYNLFILYSWTERYDYQIYARQETSKGLNCSDTLRKKQVETWAYKMLGPMGRGICLSDQADPWPHGSVNTEMQGSVWKSNWSEQPRLLTAPVFSGIGSKSTSVAIKC